MNKSIQIALLRLCYASLGRLLPNLIARQVSSVWHRAPRYQVPKREKEFLNFAKSQVIECGHLPVTVYEWGQGPNVFLVHGWSGRASQLGKIALALSDAGFRAIAIDLPAHGNTPGDKTNAFEMMEVLEQLYHHFDGCYAFVTHSFGLFPVTMLLTKHKGPGVKCLVSISPPDHIRRLVDQFRDALAIPPATMNRFYQLIEQRYGADVWDVVSADTNASSLTLPTLLIHDQNDKAVPIEASRNIHHLLCDSTLMETKGLGHLRILHDKDVLNRVVAFINDHR